MTNHEVAEILKIVSHPVRIEIIEELHRGVKCVSDFTEILDVEQPNISHHLGMMRRCGIIDFFPDGKLRCYYLKNEKVYGLIQLLKSYNEEKDAVCMSREECCPG